MVNRQGYGLGSCLSLNSGCMSHGTIGSKSSGLSKALTMVLSLLICPLKVEEDMDFSKAWFTADLAKLPVRNLEILWFLDRAVTKHFWVSRDRVRVG